MKNGFFLPAENISDAARQVMGVKSADLVLLPYLQGLMVVFIKPVPWARFHARVLPWKPFFFPSSSRAWKISATFLSNWNAQKTACFAEERITTFPWAKATWYRYRSPETPGFSGWEARCLGYNPQGIWNKILPKGTNLLDQVSPHIFCPHIRNHHVLIRTDNISAKAHIIKQGGAV